MSQASSMRRIMRTLALHEDAATPPSKSPAELLATYVERFPEEVSDSVETLKAKIMDDLRSGSLFAWAIGKLPDGRFVSGLAGSIRRFGIPIVASGDPRDIE